VIKNEITTERIALMQESGNRLRNGGWWRMEWWNGLQRFSSSRAKVNIMIFSKSDFDRRWSNSLPQTVSECDYQQLIVPDFWSESRRLISRDIYFDSISGWVRLGSSLFQKVRGEIRLKKFSTSRVSRLLQEFGQSFCHIESSGRPCLITIQFG
jgi:hypothetical protein